MHLARRRLLRTLSFVLGANFISTSHQRGIAEQTNTLPAPSAAPAGPAVETVPGAATEMERVAGIGGFFFKAHDPKTLAHWYQQNLGVLLTPTSEKDPVWRQEAGPTAFAPFAETTHYFGDDKVWMLNFRVRDLYKMAAQLQAAGIAVKIDPRSYPNGRFARLQDPEGNPIELWQPA
jgi:glyoxylase I family protein